MHLLGLLVALRQDAGEVSLCGAEDHLRSGERGCAGGSFAVASLGVEAGRLGEDRTPLDAALVTELACFGEFSLDTNLLTEIAGL